MKLSARCLALRVRMDAAVSVAKRYSWRLTAGLLWTLFLLHILGAHRFLNPVFEYCWSLLHEALRRVDLAPTNVVLFRWVVKVGWLLLITGFRIVSLIGFVFYFLALPFSLSFYLVFRRAISRIQGSTTSSSKKKPPRALSLPVRKWLTAALLLWFLLYVDGVLPAQLLLGAVFSGLLFSALVYRAIVEARPASAEDAGYLGPLEKFSQAVRKFVVEMKPPESEQEVWLLHSILEPLARFLRRITFFLRGRRGRSRISTYVFLEYLVGLLMLAGLALLFWALVIRASVLPAAVSYATLFSFVASHFLPGLPAPPLSVATQQWMHIGPAATFWFLFVLYIGPAASLLPRRQEVYLERAAKVFRTLRLDTLACLSVLRTRAKKVGSSSASAPPALPPSQPVPPPT